MLKRLLEHQPKFSFRQHSEVFGNSSEIFGSRRDISRNLGHDKVNLRHLTQKKLVGITLVDRKKTKKTVSESSQ